MSRLTSIFLIALFLNTGAGDELYAGGLRPRCFRVARGPTPRCYLSPSALARTRSASGSRQHSQTPVGATDAERGAWLARQIEDRDTGRDARIAMRMRLFDRQGRVRERALSMSSLRGGPGRPVPGDRSLVRFTHPADIKGTAFLVWEQPNADDERFLYLPSLGRVRRIAGSEAQESFVGSDFTYEDIGGREFENYTYRLIESPAPASWTAPDGIQASRLRARVAKPRRRRPLSARRLARAPGQLRRRPRRDLQQARRSSEDLRRRAARADRRLLDRARAADGRRVERTRTELVIEKVEYNVGLTPDDFSRRELERAERRPA